MSGKDLGIHLIWSSYILKTLWLTFCCKLVSAASDNQNNLIRHNFKFQLSSFKSQNTMEIPPQSTLTPMSSWQTRPFRLRWRLPWREWPSSGRQRLQSNCCTPLLGLVTRGSSPPRSTLLQFDCSWIANKDPIYPDCIGSRSWHLRFTAENSPQGKRTMLTREATSNVLSRRRVYFNLNIIKGTFRKNLPTLNILSKSLSLYVLT